MVYNFREGLMETRRVSNGNPTRKRGGSTGNLGSLAHALGQQPLLSQAWLDSAPFLVTPAQVRDHSQHSGFPPARQ